MENAPRLRTFQRLCYYCETKDFLYNTVDHTPGARHVIAVGAVTATGVVGGFSSYGPSGDGQIKPDEIAPQPQEEQIPQKTSTSASEDLDVTTNDNSDAISVRKTTKSTETKRELTQEEKEQLEREKAAEEFRKKQEKLFGNNFSNNPGNSNDGKEDGIQGDKAGSSTNKNSKGSPGNPLGNKDAVYLAKPLNTTNCNKPIELTVKINSQGNVVAITDIETALSEQSCIEAAKTAAKQNRFVSDPTREVRYAKITYDYTVSQR